MVFIFAVLFTLIRWGAALLYSAVAKRTNEAAPAQMRYQVASLVGLIRLAGSLLGPILVSVFNSLCLMHLHSGFFFGWAFVFCVIGLIFVIAINWIVIWRLEVENAMKDEAGDD